MSDNGHKVSGLTRDAAWINREYGQEKWPAIRTKIDEVISSGESSLSRVVAPACVAWDGGGHLVQTFPDGPQHFSLKLM